MQLPQRPTQCVRFDMHKSSIVLTLYCSFFFSTMPYRAVDQGGASKMVDVHQTITPIDSEDSGGSWESGPARSESGVTDNKIGMKFNLTSFP